MRLSVNATNYSWPDAPATLRSNLQWLAEEADATGLDTLWLPDHLLQADPTAGPEDTEMLEAYTVLGFLAAHTERVRLGTMVSSVTMRPPALLVKAVTTVDVLSDGRAWLGVGAGYHQDEATDLDLRLPPVPERFGRLEETLQIADQMWRGDEAPYSGRYYQLRRPVGSPLPAQRPRPGILVGGTGEKRTLRLVAQYADACNVFDIPDEGRTVRHKLGVLARHCEDVGRPLADIQKTLSTRLGPDESPEAFARRCEQAASWGVDHVIVLSSAPWTADGLARLAEAVPLVQDVAAGHRA